MAIHRFFTKNIQVRRLSVVSGHKKSYQATATVEGHIQEMSREARQKLGIVEQRAFVSWFDVDEDIREGDTLVDEHDVEYRVTEVTRKEYGVNQHLQVILQEPSV